MACLRWCRLDFNPFTVAGGIKGLFSRRLSLTLQGGYIQSNHETGESYEGPSGRFELDYRIPQVMNVRAAYELTIGDDGFSNFYKLNRAFVDTSFTLPHHLYLKGRFGLDHYTYSRFGAPEWTYTLPERIEPIFGGGSLLAGGHNSSVVSFRWNWVIVVITIIINLITVSRFN